METIISLGYILGHYKIKGGANVCIVLGKWVCQTFIYGYIVTKYGSYQRLAGNIWPKFWLYFTSHPKFYMKTYVECKIIQTSLGNIYFLQINLNLKKNSSNKNVMSNNISKFDRLVFLRPVFRPTPINNMWFLGKSRLSNYSFNNSFCQKIIIYLESLYKWILYFAIVYLYCMYIYIY
jgi:hypothetical protein